MAYSDRRGATRFNAVGIGGAVLINGVLLAGFAMLKPDILPKKLWTIIDTYDVVPDKPVELTPTPPEQAPRQSEISAPPTPDLPALPSDNSLAITDRPPVSFGDIPGPIADPLPPRADPVLTSARLDPRYAGALQPAYPSGAIRNGIEGVAIVKVLIGTDGRVKEVQSIRADDPDFLAATRKQALAKWRFVPATRDGVAIESWREMTVRFVLPEDR